jgi:hypothetical protein
MNNQRMGRYHFLSSYIVSVNASVILADLKNYLIQKVFFQSPLTEEKKYLTVFLDIRGLKKYADYLLLKEFLTSRTKIVNSIYPRRFAWQQAHFEVKILGSAQHLADELIKKGGYLLLDINQVDKNHTEINCMQKEEKL